MSLPECFNSPYGTQVALLGLWVVLLACHKHKLSILKIPSFSQHFAEYSEAVPSGPSCQALSEAAREHQVTGTDQGGSSGSNNLLGVPCGWVDT